MTYKLEITDHQPYITMIVTGELTNHLIMEQNAALTKLAEEKNITIFLVDLVNARFVGSIVDQYDYANNYMYVSKDVNRHHRLSLLVDPDDHSHDFIETVLRNNGFDVTIFRDREKAIEHLLK